MDAMTQTPRTDAIAEQVDQGRGGIWPGRAIHMYDELCRTIERELAAAKKETDEYFDNAVAFCKERDAANERAERYREALRILYEDDMDYIKINNLCGAENNHALVLARAALAQPQETET